jgi:hypothetical protein
MRALQEAFWLETGAEASQDTEATFIVGAPRTGSTAAYQFMCKDNPSYFANVTNLFFHDAPIVGLYLQAFHGKIDVTDTSRFGHTIGLYQPSEGTKIFEHWFGNEQPGESKAKEFRSVHDQQHFLRTLDAMNRLLGPPIIKNAWFCFRLNLLHQLLPKAHFIWIKRDIAAAAKSDLHARYVTKSDPLTFNACKPDRALDDLPYWQQVVENQLAYNQAIKISFASIPETQKTIWQYEDQFQKTPSQWDLPSEDIKAVDDFAAQEFFKEFRYQ